MEKDFPFYSTNKTTIVENKKLISPTKNFMGIRFCDIGF